MSQQIWASISAMQQTHVQLLFSYPVEGVVGGQIIVTKGSLIGRAARSLLLKWVCNQTKAQPISSWRCPDRHQFKGKAWQTIVGFGVRTFWDNPNLWPHADSAYSLQCQSGSAERLQRWTSTVHIHLSMLNCWNPLLGPIAELLIKDHFRIFWKRGENLRHVMDQLQLLKKRLWNHDSTAATGKARGENPTANPTDQGHLAHQLGRAFPGHPLFIHFCAPQRLLHCVGQPKTTTECTKNPHLSWVGCDSEANREYGRISFHALFMHCSKGNQFK